MIALPKEEMDCFALAWRCEMVHSCEGMNEFRAVGVHVIAPLVGPWPVGFSVHVTTQLLVAVNGFADLPQLGSR